MRTMRWNNLLLSQECHTRLFLNTAQKETNPLKVDRVTLKWYIMWYIALHILVDNL